MRPTTVALAKVEGDVSLAEVAAACADARNVGAVTGDSECEPGERIRIAWNEIDRRCSTYVLTDSDPYEALREAFVSSWQRERLEDFEVAALAAGPVPLPAFYFVLDAGTPDEDPHGARFLTREWFFGLLGRVAPSRVLPVPVSEPPLASARAVLDRLAQLPSGAPLPAARELVEHARRSAPGVLSKPLHGERSRLL
jgi:hypothetical protein